MFKRNREGYSIIFLLLLISYHEVKGQTNKVSPKLDFDDDDDGSAQNKNNSSQSPSGIGGINRGRTDARNYPNDDTNRNRGTNSGNWGNDNEHDRNTTNSHNSGSGGGGNKSGPKIHGVRVTVDTGDTQKSKESKESVEITDVGKHKKRVGIHTDITFEITADGEIESNATSSAQRRDDKDGEDASVPIFKGRGGHKSRKPHDPKSHWYPGFSAERRSGGRYDNNARPQRPSYGSYYPQYPHNIPVYTSGGSDYDGSSSTGVAGGTFHHRGDGWTQYIPVWTTERTNYNLPYRPNSVNAYKEPNWKPCLCASASTEYRERRESKPDVILQPTSSLIQVIDGKLARGFSKK